MRGLSEPVLTRPPEDFLRSGKGPDFSDFYCCCPSESNSTRGVDSIVLESTTGLEVSLLILNCDEPMLRALSESKPE